MNSPTSQFDFISFDEAIAILQSSRTSLSTLSADQLFGSIENVFKLLRNVQTSLKPNKVSFNQLPNEVLILVLRRISLQKLMHIRSVSLRWSMMIQSLFDERKTVKLLTDENLFEYCTDLMYLHPEQHERMKLKPIGQEDDLLYQPSCPTLLQNCTILPRLFPNVIHLVVHVDSTYDALPKLLSLLPKLTHLSLCGIVEWKKEDKLFAAIYSLPSLKSLDFLCYSALNQVDSLAELLPIARLKRISIRARSSLNFDPSMNDCMKIVSNLPAHCKYLELRNPDWNPALMHQPKCSTKLTNLTHFTVQHFDFLFTPILNSLNICTNLIHLSIIIEQCVRNQTISLFRVFNQITQLRKLQHLIISNADIDLSNSTTTPLSAVKSLKLLCCCTATTVYEPTNWCQTFASLFPNLEQLTFNQTIESALGDDQLENLQELLPKFKSYTTEANVADHMARHKEKYLILLKTKENLQEWNRSHFSSQPEIISPNI